ncbi:MAG: 30S ribosomal protein S5 [Candidatus Diapherotrites archaeon]|nr:30S ribosomal protein S5 [Candidatus Diapherotrites archaeon]
MKRAEEAHLLQWVPKTELAKKVRNGEITTLDQLFAINLPIMEPEIIDTLSEFEEKVVDVTKTARVVRAGRKFSFRVSVLIGNKQGYIGLGIAKDKEKWPAVRKAIRDAKMHLVKITRSCGSWECVCNTQHTVPFKVIGKNASVRLTLMPAPKGVGLVVGDHIKDVFRFAGITDVWSKTYGHTRTKLNFVQAAIAALQETNKAKLSDDIEKKLSVRNLNE